MKALIKTFQIFIVLTAMTGLISCDKNPELSGRGTAEFSLNLPAEDASKSGVVNDSAYAAFQLMISITDIEGNPVVSDSLIPLYVFGTGFLSENIELPTGQYNLTKFLVINPAGEVVFASPLEGSPLAYLVNDPLPIMFTIRPEQVTKVLPEVLYVGSHTPADFGYVNFGLQIIRPLDFWTACVLITSDNTSAGIYTQAKLTVYAPDGWHYAFRLAASVNHLIIRGGYTSYKFLVEKEGFQSQTIAVSARELMATTREKPLILKIPGSNTSVLILQPGPDAGKDAMISNLEPDKNFGDHKYFEATFLSEPILTVMRSNRSLIRFDFSKLPVNAVLHKAILRLAYDLPVPFDTAYIWQNTGITDPPTGIMWYGGVLQQVLEEWDEHKVTWNTQPKTTELGQVYINPFIRNVNFIEVDITSLYNTPSVSPVDARVYGILFRLWPIDMFPGFRFASSDYPEPSMRPRLTIYYTVN